MLLHSHPSSSSASRTRANAVVHADSADDDGGGAAAASRAAARNEGRLPTTLIGLGATSRLPSMISNSSKIAPWVWRSQGFGRTAQKAVSIARRPSLAAPTVFANSFILSLYYMPNQPVHGPGGSGHSQGREHCRSSAPELKRRTLSELVTLWKHRLRSRSLGPDLLNLNLSIHTNEGVLGCTVRAKTAALVRSLDIMRLCGCL